MTTRDDDDTRVKGLESGDDLIVKPSDKREVLARIERHTKVRSANLTGLPSPDAGGMDC